MTKRAKSAAFVAKLAAILLFCAVFLTACGGEDDAPPVADDYSSDATHAEADTQEQTPDGTADSTLALSGQAEAAKPRTAQNTAQTSVDTEIQQLAAPRSPWPMAHSPYADRPILRIEIAYVSDILMDDFDYVHHFDYSVVRAARGCTYDAQSGYSFVIWANQPLAGLDVMLLGAYSTNPGGRNFYVPFQSFSAVAALQVREALVISNFAGFGRPSLSGINFTDVAGINHHFSIFHNPISSHFRGHLHLDEFELRNEEWLIGLRPWWERDLLTETARRFTLPLQNRFDITSAIETPCDVRRAELLSQAGISEYGWQVTADFLADFDSLFTQVGFPLIEWDFDWRIARIVEGYYTWESWSAEADTGIRPEIIFVNSYIYGHEPGFFDRNGNRIADVPWLTLIHETYWHFADHFSLFDFNGSGIPDIIIHFRQTFTGQGYAGFHQILRYIDGEFVILEPHFEGDSIWMGLSTWHRLFVDKNGRIITLLDDMKSGFQYNILEIVGNKATFRVLPLPRFDGWYRYWQNHHWFLWETVPRHYRENVLVGSWLDNNPTIFGTDIAITPLDPFRDLGAELIEYLRYTR